MPTFEVIQPFHMTSEEVELLQKFDSMALDDSTYEEVLQQAYERTALILRMKEGIEGLLICKVLENRFGKQLFIWRIIGKDFFKNSEEWFKDLKKLAKAFGCSKITGWAIPPLVKHYLKVGGRINYVHMSLEVEDG